VIAPYDKASESITIRQLSTLEFVAVLPDLIDLFLETVNGGSPLGFLAPITRETVRDYLISLFPEVEAGSRLVLVAYRNNVVVGSGQLALSLRSNSPHRAELERLFVERASRGQGIGTSLMHGLHSLSRQNGRTLILLNTRRGELAEAFYKGLGYREVGVIPGWTIGAGGERYDHVTLYLELTPVN
jgi:ribosomal protein S18 acetylase RimI-like enzyme